MSTLNERQQKEKKHSCSAAFTHSALASYNISYLCHFKGNLTWPFSDKHHLVVVSQSGNCFCHCSKASICKASILDVYWKFSFVRWIVSNSQKNFRLSIMNQISLIMQHQEKTQSVLSCLPNAFTLNTTE